MAQPLMPHATAAWLVENTSLTLRADRRVLRAAHPRGPGDRRRYRGDQADRPRPDPRRRADPRGDREGPGRLRLSAADAQGAGPGPPHQGPALHAGQQAPGQARRHRLDHPQPSRGQRRPDRQADRHDPHDHRRDPRAHATGTWRTSAEGPGDARPDLAARARCGRCQGAEGGRARRLRPTRRSTATARR